MRLSVLHSAYGIAWATRSRDTIKPYQVCPNVKKQRQSHNSLDLHNKFTARCVASRNG